MIEDVLDTLQVERSSIGNLEAFIENFEKWNRSINLSAASTRAEIVEHVVDCLHVVPHLRGRAHVLDVGSGGGLPVVITAICLPAIKFTALEPVHKKHAFLRTAARELRLRNLEARAERYEDHEKHDYDAAMSRATFDLAEWLAIGASFVNESGIVLGFEALRRDDLPPSLERHPYKLEDKSRAIVIVSKRST